MRELFSESAQILNANIVLVLLVGVCNIQILSGAMAYLSLLGLTVSFITGIIIYARIAAKVQGASVLPVFEAFKANWVNYIVVVILLGLPVYIYAQLSKLFPMSVELSIYGKEGVRTLVNILTMYVLPIVFIKRQNLLAIMAGLMLFIHNLKKSTPIIIIVVCMFFVNTTAMFWLIKHAQPAPNMLTFLPVMVFVNIAVTYLSFLAFTAASVVLIPRPKDEAVYGV